MKTFDYKSPLSPLLRLSIRIINYVFYCNVLPIRKRTLRRGSCNLEQRENNKTWFTRIKLELSEDLTIAPLQLYQKGNTYSVEIF